MTQPLHDFKMLKQSVTIHQVLADRGLGDQLKRRGDRLIGPCPVHGGDNPNAFVVSLSRNLWHCFSRCGQGGDVIDLVRRLDDLTYAQAGAYLASLAACALLPPPSQLANGNRAPRRKPFRPFTRRLTLDPRAPVLTSKGIKPSTAAHFEAGAYHGPGFLHNCIGVRLHDLDGRPLGYAGRRLLANHANRYGKWKLPPGLPKSSMLYGFHRIASSLDRDLCVVEGPWAVMRLYQLGIPAVALLGSSLSGAQRRLLARAPNIVLLLDGDTVGARAARQICIALRTLTNVRIASPPDNLDPDDLTDQELASYVRPQLPV